jgi:HupE / UreJ protein
MSNFYRWPLRFFSVLTGLTLSIFGHPTGVSKIDLTLKSDTLIGLVDVNGNDLFYALRIKSDDIGPSSKLSEISDRIAYYCLTRLELRFDGVGAKDSKILAYRKHGEDPALKLDSASLVDTTIVLKFAWPIPLGAKRLELSAKLFAELEVQPLSHIRVFYRNQEIKSRFLDLDSRMFLELAPDSLEALYTAARNPPVAGSPGATLASDDEPIFGRFLGLGFTHILPEGLDHILFVLGLFFFSTLLRPLLIQITAFTIAHSITLGLSLYNIISLPSRLVEPLIALSIIMVAVENIFFRKMRPSRFLIVFGFGLIHGLGFASVLKGLGLPDGQFFKVLVSFNLGVEAGQLTVVAGVAALTVWMWKKPWYFARVVVPVSSLIAGVGLFWFIQRLLAL